MKYLIIIFVCLSLCFTIHTDQTVKNIDPLQYPKGYPDTSQSVIQQLTSYPLPRYLPTHKLLHLFNWMDPYYMGGNGRKGINKNTMFENAVQIQKELITNWHYGIVIPNAGVSFSGPKINGCPLFINLANERPDVPLHVITLWMQVRPKAAGYSSFGKAAILSKSLDSSLYIDFDFYGRAKREINFVFPDSLIQIDGHTQKYYLNRMVKYLTRPIDLINENGEEPPGPYLLEAIQKDPVMIQLKKILKNETWEEFMAERKLHLRKVYSDCFMKEIPELKNTKFNFYANEGGPVNCFEWAVMKRSMTPVNGNYYSTPDFYPRWPRNWKDWDGPWHGWKWIESGRKKEVKAGDHLFSPFVAAGWSKVQEEDIQPGQWLGLLKCLAGLGAEFYYVGYFSLSKPYTDPAKWAWQAVIPAYAQAVTSRFEDVLKDGNVLFDIEKTPIITYKTNDKHVLVTVRKHNQKEKYVICGSYQPFSNEAGEIPEKRNVNITIVNQEFSFEIRRQGSVYVYEKTNEGKVLFYQLDSWHENAHPDHWSKDFYFEAEVADTLLSNKQLTTVNENEGADFTNFTTYLSLTKTTAIPYKFTQRNNDHFDNSIWIKYKGNGEISLILKSAKLNAQQTEKLPVTTSWKWHKIKLKSNYVVGANTVLLQLKTGAIDLDKIIITQKDKVPIH
ncbi:MAG: hypothetical protein V4677_03355 [Bacteroidota bacterium]